MKIIRLLAPMLLLVAVSFAQTGRQAAPASATANQAVNAGPGPGPLLTTRTPRYEVRPGDVLQLTFSFTPEFNQELAVQPDGFISLKAVGDVYVVGKTVPQITELVRKAYGNTLHAPEFSVGLKSFEEPHFVVAGQVGKPGKYELRADTTVTEAVAIAGGFTSQSKHSQVLLFRRVNADWVSVKKLDVKEIYAGDFREDVHLQAGDMLFVPQNKISKIKPFLPIYGLSTYMTPIK